MKTWIVRQISSVMILIMPFQNLLDSTNFFGFNLLFQKYKNAGQDTIVLAGAEYGSGSSRDWAAKGPMLLVSLCT